MENLLFFIIGALLVLLITKKPFKIIIEEHHIDDKKPITPIDMDALEEKMLKEDPKMDQAYKDLDETLKEVNDIMGGSDRV